jgi:hypothetical protein
LQWHAREIPVAEAIRGLVVHAGPVAAHCSGLGQMVSTALDGETRFRGMFPKRISGGTQSLPKCAARRQRREATVASRAASDGEVTFLLAALRLAVERSSIRDVAVRSGISHGGIHRLMGEQPGRIYGKTLRKLRHWYLQEWAAGGDSLTPDVAAYLVEQEVAAIPPGYRKAAALELVQAVERIYKSYSTPPPAWLMAVRNEFAG